MTKLITATDDNDSEFVRLKDRCRFAMDIQTRHLLTRQGVSPRLVTIFDQEDRKLLERPDMAWRDVATGLTWDAERLFSHEYSHLPGKAHHVMNALSYAGHSDWRLPTVDELKTLSSDTHFHLRLQVSDHKWALNFWTSERISEPDDWYYVNLESLQSGWQRFREEHRDRSTRWDGYQVQARTLYVRGAIC